jgi:hypothetical protein
MSQTFTKLFASITESTLWLEPDGTRLVWITMLTMADEHGRVLASVPGLAHRARVPLEDARKAIASLLSPDPDSRTKDHEGRRIEEIDGGWRLYNHAKYRELRSTEDRKVQVREAQQRRRDKLKALKDACAEASSVVMTRMTRDDESAESAHTEAEAEKEISAAAQPRRQRKAADAARALKSAIPPCPYDAIIALYHAAMPMLPRVRTMDADRKTEIRGLWEFAFTTTKDDGTPRATNTEEGVAWIATYFRAAAANGFINGTTPRSSSHANWEAKIDYVCSAKGRRKVLEERSPS